MTIWREFANIPVLFNYIVLQHSHYTGHVLGVDWQAVDILLRREQVDVSAIDFANFRIASSGYINAINAYQAREQ